MSEKHPIISVTGSSASGQTQLLTAFSHLVWRIKARWSIVHGDGFHKYDREAYMLEVEKAHQEKRSFSHFLARPGAGTAKLQSQQYRKY